MDKKPGTYLLVMRLKTAGEIKVGALGEIPFSAGWYLYVGSAFGPGGLQARVMRHLSPRKKPFWHIDYLSSRTNVVECWITEAPSRLEHRWAEVLLSLESNYVPVPGFGSSDCSCCSHLFSSPTQPDLAHFLDHFQRRTGMELSRQNARYLAISQTPTRIVSLELRGNIT